MSKNLVLSEIRGYIKPINVSKNFTSTLYEFCRSSVRNKSYFLCVEGWCLRPPPLWDCGFESRRRYGRLSLVSAVCCQVSVWG